METFTFKLELKLNGVNWTNCTGDVSLEAGALEVANGHNSISLTDLLANPGSIGWAFDNSPANSAGLAGYYTPGHTNCRSGFAKNVQVRYSELYNSVRTYQGVYWLQKPIPSAGVFGEAVTRCRAIDWLGKMVVMPFPCIPVQFRHTADELIADLLASITPQPAGADFDTGGYYFATGFDIDDVRKDTVYSILGKIARSEYGRIFLQPSTGGGGVLTFENRGADAAKTTPLGTISNTMDDIDVIDNEAEIYDRVRVTVAPRRIEGTERAFVLAILDYIVPLAAYAEKKFTIYSIEQSVGGRIAGWNHTTPQPTTGYKFGSVGDGESENLNDYLEVTIYTYGGNSIDGKLKNIGAVGGYINLFQIRGQGIYAYNPYTGEAGTSGQRVLQMDMPYQDDPSEALILATTLQPIASDNTRRGCRVKFHANKSAALMAAAQTGLISTRWTIAEDQTALNSDFFIAGCKRTVSLGARLDVEWLCRPV